MNLDTAQIELENAYIRQVLDARFQPRGEHGAPATGVLKEVAASLARLSQAPLQVERRGRQRELTGLVALALPITMKFLRSHLEESGVKAVITEYLACEFWGAPSEGVVDAGQHVPVAVSFAETLARQGVEQDGDVLQVAALLAKVEHCRTDAGRRPAVLGTLAYDLMELVDHPSTCLDACRLTRPHSWRVNQAGALEFDGPKSFALAPDVRVLLRSARLDGYHGECANYMVFGERVQELRAAHQELLQSGKLNEDSVWFSESEGAYRLHEHLYFQPTPSVMEQDLKLSFSSRSAARELRMPLTPQRMKILSSLIPMLHERRSQEKLEADLKDQWDFVRQLAEAGILRVVPEPAPVQRGPYSVTLAAHSCLKFQTPTSSLLIDPLITVRNRPEYNGSYLLRDAVGAVVVTHSHWDHFNLDSLMLLNRNTEFILPARRHATSVVNLDMRVALRDLGFHRIVELAPWQTHRVGDIELMATPYFGEGHGPEAPTDWLTYLVRLGGKSILGLVDSCVDDFGKMDDVLRRLRHEEGAVDVLFAPCSGYRYPHASYIYRPFYLCHGLDKYTGNHDDVERWSAIVEAKCTVPYALFHLQPEDARQDAELARNDGLRFSSSEQLAELIQSQPEGPLAMMSPGDALAWQAEGQIAWQQRTGTIWGS